MERKEGKNSRVLFGRRIFRFPRAGGEEDENDGDGDGDEDEDEDEDEA